MKITSTTSPVLSFLSVAALILLAGCAQPMYDTKSVTYDPEGAIKQQTHTSAGQVISELKREFATDAVEGEGSFTHSNAALARRSATQLAVAELASKVEVRVKSNTKIYNNQDVRDVVQTKMAALVQNYSVEEAHYDKENSTYTVTVRIEGRRLVDEFETRLNN